jgi:hypothetical protein
VRQAAHDRLDFGKFGHLIGRRRHFPEVEFGARGNAVLRRLAGG